MRDMAFTATASTVAAVGLTAAAAWATHCVWWIGLMADGNMEVWQGVLAVLGVVAPPIGVVHGIMLWFS